MKKEKYDLIIVGAGPAGFACAYSLHNTALRIALIDQSKFPRDKICGDAMSADVVNQLYRMNPNLLDALDKFHGKLASHGIRFVAPNHQVIEFSYQNPNLGKAAGYVSKRLDFDNFLFQHLSSQENLDIYQNEKIIDLRYNDFGVDVISDKRTFSAKMIVGADGAHSIVNRKLGNIKVEKEHYSAGIRQYFEGISGFHASQYIELHFYKELLPGYFWIFPLANNQSNVGLGMLSSEVSKQKMDLKLKLNEIIETIPALKERFKNAKALEKPKGFGLPLGSKKRVISGDHFLLLGDAAGLIDPFTGEGIGNAIRSGRIAANHIKNAFIMNSFSANFNSKYDREIYHKMWHELSISRKLQRLLRFPALFNFVVKKANRNSSVRTILSSMLDNVDLKKELLKPSFYFKLFIGDNRLNVYNSDCQ